MEQRFDVLFRGDSGVLGGCKEATEVALGIAMADRVVDEEANRYKLRAGQPSPQLADKGAKLIEGRRLAGPVADLPADGERLLQVLLGGGAVALVDGDAAQVVQRVGFGALRVAGSGQGTLVPAAGCCVVAPLKVRSADPPHRLGVLFAGEQLPVQLLQVGVQSLAQQKATDAA